MSEPRLPSALWLVRHAESAGNVARELARQTQAERIEIAAARDHDVPLSERGAEQARALGDYLAGLPARERPEAVFSSPYLRARRTAELALEAGALRAPLRIDERLRERELGAFDRLTRRGIERLFPAEAAQRRALGKFYHRPPAGESWCDVILRLRSALATMASEHADRRVLVFCHSAVVLCFRYVLEGMTEQQILEVDRDVEVANCSITSYELRDGRLQLDRFNFVAPLRERGAPVTAEPDAQTPPK